MTVTAKDLRFNSAMLFDMLGKGEEILITYRGKPRAKLVSCDEPTTEAKSDAIFGMWADAEGSVDEIVRGMRAGRSFGV